MNRLTYWLWTVCIVTAFVALLAVSGRFVDPSNQDNLVAFVTIAYVFALGYLRFVRAQDMGSKHPFAWAVLGAIPLVHLICGCYASSLDRQVTAGLEKALAIG